MFLKILPFCLLLVACAPPKPASQLKSKGQQETVDPTIADCRIQFTKLNTCLAWKWKTVPTVGRNAGVLLFKMYRPNKFDKSPVTVDPPNDILPNIMLRFPSAESHNVLKVAVERLDIGTFRANNVPFDARGKWEMHFQIAADSKTLADELSVDVSL